MAVMFLLGFSSGLPLLLTGQTLQAWMTDAGVKLEKIAAFSAVGLAYTFKFLWAPLLDRYRLPGLPRRRGWILVLQLALVAAIASMGALDPVASPGGLAIAAVVVAFLSASQDIVIDAYNADLLAPEERAAGSATYVMGYRSAMLVAGTLALVLADHLVWRAVYLILAGVMALGLIGTWLAEEPSPGVAPPRTIGAALTLPFVELWRRLGWRGAALTLGFAATYKFGEQFAQVLTMTYFKRVIGFTFTDIALANKLVGFSAWAIGGAVGGGLVARHGVRRTLVWFGVLQASTHVAYLLVGLAGKNLPVYAAAIFVENLSFSMATAAFVAALMAVCSPAVSATQFALLTSLSSVGQRIFGPLAADVVDWLGWRGFFLSTIAMAVPGILLAWRAPHPDARAGAPTP